MSCPPRFELRESIAVGERVARYAIVALGVRAGGDVLVGLARASRALYLSQMGPAADVFAALRVLDDLVQVAASACVALTVLAAVFFLCWLHRAYLTARAMHQGFLRFTAAEAVWSFFVPVLNLWRPYQVVRELDRAADPAALPELPGPVEEGLAHYRTPAAAPQAGGWSAGAPVGRWWTLWLLTYYGDCGEHHGVSEGPYGVMFSDGWAVLRQACSIGALLAAIHCVRAINARLHERARRALAAEPFGPGA
jgi:hypothetical protein